MNGKFDELSKKCTVTTELKTVIEGIDKNTFLVKGIGSSYGYIWESLNNENQIYTTSAFEGLIFRTTS